MKTHPDTKRNLKKVNRSLINSLFKVDSKTTAGSMVKRENRDIRKSLTNKITR